MSALFFARFAKRKRQVAEEMLAKAHKVKRMDGAAIVTAAAILCASAAWAQAPHWGGAAAFQFARGQGGRMQTARPGNESRSPMQGEGRPQASAPRRPGSGYPSTAPRPAYPGSGYPGSGYPGSGYPRPAYPGSPYPGRAYPGTPYGGAPYGGPNPSRPAYSGYGPTPSQPSHLGVWLNQHRNLPVQEQERVLRGDPSFRRLPTGEQQRVIQQLHEVDRLPEPQQQRRLGRAEMIERLSPQQRMQIDLSARRWAALPPDRQAIVKRAFQDLRRVPLDQRQTVLSSSRYQGVFTPEERGIISDLLRVEPYQPAQ